MGWNEDSFEEVRGSAFWFGFWVGALLGAVVVATVVWWLCAK